MKIHKTLLQLVFFGLAVNAATANAAVVYNESAHGDIHNAAGTYEWVGPTVGSTSSSDTTPFGPGTYTIQGSAIQNAADEIDAFNWSTTGDFVLTFAVTPTDFIGVCSSPNAWNCGDVHNPGWYIYSNTTGISLTAGDYSAGVTSNGGAKNWWFTITVAEPVPEPSTLALFALSVTGLAMSRRRKPTIA